MYIARVGGSLTSGRGLEPSAFAMPNSSGASIYVSELPCFHRRRSHLGNFGQLAGCSTALWVLRSSTASTCARHWTLPAATAEWVYALLPLPRSSRD